MSALFYPVALNLQGKRCLVVGGGEIADGKLDALLAAGADLLVVSPEVKPRVNVLASEGRLRLELREFQPADLDGIYLLYAATDDRPLNAEIAELGRERGIIVNAVDDPPFCDFYAVALVRRGDLQVAISTNGQSPAFARWMRETLDESLPQEYAPLLESLGTIRKGLHAQNAIPEYEHWKAAITPEVLEHFREGRDDIAHELLRLRLTDATGQEQVAD